MSIEIDRKNVGIYSKKYVGKEWIDKYKITKELYRESDLFELIVHKEIKSTPTIYLTFKSRSLNINYKSFNFKDTNNLEKVEVYFSLLQPTIPLLVGIITNRAAKYYFASALKKLNGDISGKDLRISHEQLLDKLIEENNNQNNVITYRLDKKPGDTYDGVGVVREDHPSFDKYKHKPTGNLNGKTVYVLYKGKQIQLSKGQSYRGSGRELKPIQEKCYCEIIVWHFKPSNKEKTNPPKYLELKENNGQDFDNHTYYLEISDYVGVFWGQIEDPKLDYVITYLLDTKPLNSEKYNDNSIEVTKSTNDSFEFYTHTPDLVHGNKKGYLRFTDKDLELVQNDHLGAETARLDKFNCHTYCSVSLVYYKGCNTGLPEFLDLNVKGNGDGESENQGCNSTSKSYLFQIADTEGVKWTQIEYQNLKETVTFQLELKNTIEYNDGVRVTSRSEPSFQVYSHIPKQNHKDKSGLLLFKSKMLTLQPNDGLTSTTKLDKIHGKKYCKVDLYYTSLISNKPPVFIQLSENKGDNELCELNGVETETNLKCYWLERLDNDAWHWKQIKKPENLYSEATQLLSTILNNDKNSIVVKLTEQNWYGMKTLKHYVTNGIGILTNPQKDISVKLKGISGSSYRYYEHSFTQSSDLLSLKIERLRLFIENTEINLLGTGARKQTLPFNPTWDTNNMVCVYFTAFDNIPLLLYYRNEWYGPNKKEDYLDKWNMINELQSDQPTSNSNSQITQELDKINKRLNEIDLSKTSDKGYGITKPKQNEGEEYYKSHNLKFDGKRVIVAQECVKKFGKITHSTKNKSSIGKVLLETKELENDKGKKLSQALSDEPEFRSAAAVSVIAYYHRTDSGYTKPLLLGFLKTGSRNNIPEVFYERQSVNDDSRWEKIQGITDLRGDDGIAKRVDKIRYTIGKSVKIRMDKQPVGDSSDNYEVQLIPNTNGSGGHGPVDTKQITVTQNSSTTTQHTGYTCFTHEIPNLGSSTASVGSSNNSYVSGLKLYISEKTYMNTNVPIYYDLNHREVKVYFYGNSGTGSNPPIDKVPLLAEYNKTFYKPKSKVDYFNRWDRVEVSASDQVTTVHKTLQQVLDEINKEMNTIELDTTGGAGGYKYGIKPPDSDAGNCGSGTKIEGFCSRVSVERENGHREHYLMVTHSTNNKGPIGDITYRGQPVKGINADGLGNGCNKVEVYYRADDSGYNKPLLICLGSQETANSCIQWYYRRNMEGTEWKHDHEFRKYNTEHNIRDQLNQINASMSVFLYLQIDKQEQYEILAKSGSETKGKEHKAYIGIDNYGACSYYDPGTNYRCFKHKMSEYYNLNEADIRLALQTQEKPTLEVKINIVDHQLNLVNSHGSSLPTQLTYGQNEQGTDTNPYVYFFEYSGQTDKVPLLFMFGKKFFGPVSKHLFFERWEEYTINTSTGATADNIKTTLNQITRLLNLIDLQQTSTDYGDIERPGDPSHKPLGAERRVSVTKHNHAEYISVTHSTANTGCVGTVKYQDTELKIIDDLSSSTPKQWSEAIEAELKSGTKATVIYNDITAYYHITDRKYTNPLLIKISGSSGTHAKVQDLYYERAKKDDKLMWKKVGAEELLKFKDDSWVTDNINRIYNAVNENVAISLGQSPSYNQYDMNVVQDRGQETSSSDPKNGDTASSLNPDHPATSSIPSQQHTVSTDGFGEQLPGQSARGEYVTQDSHVTEHQQESQVPEASGHLTGSPTDMGTPGDDRRKDGEAGAKGENGPPGPSGENADRSSSSGTEANDTNAQSSGGIVEQFTQFFTKVKEYAENEPGIFYGSTGGSVAGVGVMATVGGVVYKKCIVGSAVAAGKAAAKVAASAASGM